MKRAITTAFAVFFFTMSAQAVEKSAKIAVGELSCPSCAFIVSNAMKQVSTVEVVDFKPDEVNWWEGTFTVTYDDASATPAMIVEAIKSYGYPASVAADDES